MSSVFRFVIAPPLLLSVLAAPSLGQDTGVDTSAAGNAKVAEIMRTFSGRGVQADDSEPTSPKQATKQFQMLDGLEIELVASEPSITQPLFLSWDSRGRLWVVQYRQYQYPAGLKVIRYDQHLRAVFDRVPEPPPHGTPGADRITVFEDSDGDGRYENHRDVIKGLNIATSVQVGRGGIWVLNPPYLLFYPDPDRDGLPDGDPEVHLSGFGLQDTHSVANSLTWGPDGWLYGASGSTTTGSVSSARSKGVSFQGQCIWRYHPKTKVFEIYAEGGGNTFSLEIDSKGRVFSGTNGGNTRGWYYPQGSYSAKRWGKHGPLTNPYAFGYFPPMRFEGDGRRFPQAFCIYEGGLFSERFSGSIIAPNSLHNLVWHSLRIPDGSTYRTVDQPNMVETDDRWFRPVYCGVGPDGAVYLADWYDTRLSHVSPVDDWHKSSGRIYRIAPASSRPVYTEGDLSQLDSNKLIDLFGNENKWVRRRATLELGWRGDRTVVPRLINKVEREGTLEALWSLDLIGGLSREQSVEWLSHESPHIRRWVTRLLGDRHVAEPALVDLAESEDEIQVRSQLASTAKRIAPKVAVPIVRELMTHSEDLADPHQPLMIWWALEAHADAWPEVAAICAETELWQLPIMQEVVASRLMQRYAASGSKADLRRCAELFEMAPDDRSRRQLVIGLNRAFEGQSMPPLPDSLAAALDSFRSAMGASGLVLRLRQHTPGAIDEALTVLNDRSAELLPKLDLAKTLGEVKYDKAVKPLIDLAVGRKTDEPALQRVAMRSLSQYDDAAIPEALISGFGGEVSNEHGLRATACRVLASRPEWAEDLLEEITSWRLKREDVPVDVVQQLRAYEDRSIAEATKAAFGPAIATNSEQKLSRFKEIRQIVSDGSGTPSSGKKLFTERCAKCHQLFGEGKKVGPALDGYERGNVNFWLTAIVEPSLEIREGFQSYLALTTDGRVINGMIAAQDPQTVTLRNADNELTILQRDQIERLQALSTSLMPEDTLKDLSDQQLRDLFQYLMLGTRGGGTTVMP